jgi:hypothetical protein
MNISAPISGLNPGADVMDRFSALVAKPGIRPLRTLLEAPRARPRGDPRFVSATIPREGSDDRVKMGAILKTSSNINMLMHLRSISTLGETRLKPRKTVPIDGISQT